MGIPNSHERSRLKKMVNSIEEPDKVNYLSQEFKLKFDVEGKAMASNSYNTFYSPFLYPT